VNGFEVQEYEMRWYATFWDERGDQLERVQVGQGKIAIPLLATYMTFDAEIRRGGKSEDRDDVR